MPKHVFYFNSGLPYRFIPYIYIAIAFLWNLFPSNFSNLSFTVFVKKSKYSSVNVVVGNVHWYLSNAISITLTPNINKVVDRNSYVSLKFGEKTAYLEMAIMLKILLLI